MVAQMRDVAPDQNWNSSFTVTPEQTKSLFHYMFVAVDGSGGVVPGGGIDVSENQRYFGIRAIERGRFTLLQNKMWTDLRAAIGGDEESLDSSMSDDLQGFTVGKKDRVCYASENAARLEANYWDHYGAVCIGALIGIPEAVARWVERMLLPAAGTPFYELERHIEAFDIDRMPAAPQSPQWAGWVAFTGTDVRKLVLDTRVDLMRSCGQGKAFGETYYSDYVAEMRQSLIPGRGGVSVVSDKLRLLCKEFGFPTPDDLANQVRVAQANPGQGMPTEIKIPGLEQLIQVMLAQGFTINPPPAVAVAPNDQAKASEFVERTFNPPAKPENWDIASTPAAQLAEELPLEEGATAANAPTRSLIEKTADEEAFGETAPVAQPVLKCGGSNREGNPCGQKAGHGTDHPGVGNCKDHE